EMELLRKKQIQNETIHLEANMHKKIVYNHNITAELVIDFDNDQLGYIEFELFNTIGFNYSDTTGAFMFQRENFKNSQKESRSCEVKQIRQLRLFIDKSSIEIFVNEGEEVFTSRYFITKADQYIYMKSNQDSNIRLQIWNLKSYSIKSQLTGLTSL